MPTKDPPNLASDSTYVVPILGSSDQTSFHSSEDAPPSEDTVGAAVEEAHSNAEESQPPIEETGPSASNILLPLESTPQLEAAVDPPVQLAPASSEPLTPLAENRPAPTCSVSIPDGVALMAAANTPTQVEAVHAPAQLACSSLEPFTLPIESNLATTSSSEPIPHRDTSPSDSVRLPAEAVHLSDQPTRAPPEPPTLPICNELAPTSSAPTPDIIHSISDHTSPHTEAVQAPVYLARTLSERLTSHTNNDPSTASCAPTPIKATSPLDDTPPQAEASHSPVQLVHTLPKSVALAISMPNPGRLDSPSDVTRPQSETFCPPVQPAPAPPGPLPPIRSEPTPVDSPAPDIISPPLQRLPQVETARRISRTVLESRVSSIVATVVPPPHKNPSSKSRPQVEKPRPPVQFARTPPDHRTASSGNKIDLANGAPQLDVKDHSSPRPRIKSHPKKMGTSIGQRRPTVLPGQMAPPLTVQQVSQPMLRPVEQSSTSLVRSSSNVVPVTRQGRTSDSSHRTSSERPSPLGTIPEIRGEKSKSIASGQQTASPVALVGGAITIPTSVAPNRSSRGPSMITQEPPGQSRQAMILPKQIVPQLTMQPSDQPTTRPVEQALTNLAPHKNNSALVTRQDRIAGVLPHTSLANLPSLAIIPEAQGDSKSHSMTPATARQIAATAEQIGGGIAISSSALSGRTDHMPSMTRIKDSAGQLRQSTTVPDQPTPHLTVRPRCQSMIRLPEQYATSPALKRSNADSAANARQGRTTEVLSYNSRTDIPSIVAAPEIRGDYKGHSLRSTTTASAPSAWNGTPRISSRIKTKDLISRHKPQIASDGRPLTVSPTHSLFKSSTSNTAQIAPLASKPGANRVDSGIELWDYGDIHGGRDGLDASANRFWNPPHDRGSVSALPTNRFATASNGHSEDGINPLLPLKESPTSRSQTHPLVTAGSPSTDLPPCKPPGRREPFINRKPQSTFQTTTQGGGTTAQPEYSTPPRSATPSSTSHSTSITTSTQATMVTSVTSFSLPSRGPSPPLKAVYRSWFRRNVIDPMKVTLGYDS
jgi:hypothetical protein